MITIDQKDKTAKFELWFGRRAVLILMVALELWSHRLLNGERETSLLSVGWYTRPDAPGICIVSVVLLWLSCRVAVNWSGK